MPEDPNLALLLDRFVRRLHLSLQRKAPGFDTHRIGPGGAMILLTLAEIGDAPMLSLSRMLARDKSQMTRGVRALEEKGLVQRMTSRRDARVTVISLTAEGRSVVGTHQRIVAETIDEILSPLGGAKSEELKSLLVLALQPAAEDRTGV